MDVNLTTLVLFLSLPVIWCIWWSNLLKPDSLVLWASKLLLFSLNGSSYSWRFHWDKGLLSEPKETSWLTVHFAWDQAPWSPQCLWPVSREGLSSLAFGYYSWFLDKFISVSDWAWPIMNTLVAAVFESGSVYHLTIKSFLSGGRCQKLGPSQLPAAAGIWFSCWVFLSVDSDIS